MKLGPHQSFSKGYGVADRSITHHGRIVVRICEKLSYRSTRRFKLENAVTRIWTQVYRIREEAHRPLLLDQAKIYLSTILTEELTIVKDV